MASSILKGLVANYGKLGYQLWHRPFKMALLVYEREIGAADALFWNTNMAAVTSCENSASCDITLSW